MFDVESPFKPYRHKDTPKPRRGILKPPRAPLPSGCGECSGRPWVTVISKGIAYSQRCQCERGDYLRAKDAERRRM